MHYLIRLDDITPYMSKEKFEAVQAILDKYRVRPIIGVVPDCRDESIHGVTNARRNDSIQGPLHEHGDGREYSDGEYKLLIHELIEKGWTVAQHGTYHVYETKESGLLGINPFSEYAGLPYEAQYEKLKHGKDLLKDLGIAPALFMAPGHTFDENTLKALKALGFLAITDGLYPKPYIRDDILFVPCTLVAYDKLKGLDTICLHPNLMNDKDMADLENFLKDHCNEALSYNHESLRRDAINYGPFTAMAEKSALKARQRRDRIAHSMRLSNFMVCTDHPNSAIKWAKRIIMSPLLLSKRYDDIK